MIRGLPERLRDLRIRCGYAQRQVANTLRVSPSIISSYETGERTPSTENLLALSYLYRCSTDYLLGREDNQTPQYLDTQGLSPEQVRLLSELIATMRK